MKSIGNRSSKAPKKAPKKLVTESSAKWKKYLDSLYQHNFKFEQGEDI